MAPMAPALRVVPAVPALQQLLWLRRLPLRQVVPVDRPAPALELLSRRQDIALVFSDIVMPGDMDGLALARAVREQRLDALVLRDVVHDPQQAPFVGPVVGHLHDLDTE